MIQQSSGFPAWKMQTDGQVP
ncbi:hypothetical protein BN165_1040115 [Clostridioides difficile E1]|nr:hypothetical protein BN163_1140043 [Clostridioides difficile T5]CCK94246.1 hypothetical protein BN165_1040115 [Clostridioides difficile E1]